MEKVQLNVTEVHLRGLLVPGVLDLRRAEWGTELVKERKGAYQMARTIS